MNAYCVDSKLNLIFKASNISLNVSTPDDFEEIRSHFKNQIKSKEELIVYFSSDPIQAKSYEELKERCETYLIL